MAIQARYGTKAKYMITTPELLKGKTIPTSLINAIPPPPFLEAVYLKKHLQREKSFVKSAECLLLKTTWQNSSAFNPSPMNQCYLRSVFTGGGGGNKKRVQIKGGITLGSLGEHKMTLHWILDLMASSLVDTPPTLHLFIYINLLKICIYN